MLVVDLLARTIKYTPTLIPYFLIHEFRFYVGYLIDFMLNFIQSKMYFILLSTFENNSR